MGMRFRKSFKLLPGVKVNMGKKSIGVSVGNKYGGVSINSKTGARSRVSIPGTGISFSETTSSHKKKNISATPNSDIEPCSMVFDERVVRSLNDAAFNDYLLSYSAYARTVSNDDPEMEEVERQISILQKEQIRRFKEDEEKKHKANEPSLLLFVCGLICGVCGIFISFFSLWGFAFLGIGIIMLLAEYGKKG